MGDITYIHTWQGFIYLATVIDCYSKKVVGWSIADHMRTELVADALTNAADASSPMTRPTKLATSSGRACTRCLSRLPVVKNPARAMSVAGNCLA